MRVSGITYVGCVKDSLRHLRKYFNHKPRVRCPREGHRVCDRHDEDRELRAELLGVVLSIRRSAPVHRIPAGQAYSARGKRREVMVNITTL